MKLGNFTRADEVAIGGGIGKLRNSSPQFPNFPPDSNRDQNSKINRR